MSDYSLYINAVWLLEKYEAAGRDTGTTILVIPVFYQYLPVSAILVHNTGNTSILPVSSSICNTGTDTGKY